MPEPRVLTRDAVIEAADVGTRSLTVQLLRWNDPRIVADPGAPRYVESWGPGSLVPLDDLYVVDRHGGELIGRMEPPLDAGVGPSSRLHIAHTRAGDDLLALVDARVIRSVSVEALSDPAGEQWSPDHRHVHRTRGHLAGVAFAFRAAHDSPILARTYGGLLMPESTTPPGQAPPASPTPPNGAGDPLADVLASLQALDRSSSSGPDAAQSPPPPPTGGAAGGLAAVGAPFGGQTPPSPGVAQAGAQAGAVGSTADQLAALLAQRAAPPAGPGMDEMQHQLVVMRSAMLTLVDRQRTPAVPRIESWGQWLRASAAGELTAADFQALNRALVDVTTGDIPGLIPRAVIAQIMDIIAANQVLADAMGQVPLPDSGMSIDYPQVTARPTVAPQTAEKTDIASAKTHVARQSANLFTLAGGEDVSIQAILRSQPAYLQLMGELYVEAMAIATNAQAWTSYLAVVPAAHKVSIGAAATGWNQALFDLAALVLTDHRALPTSLVISVDMWAKFGGATDTEGRPIFTNVGMVNPMGTARLTSTEGDVRELAFRVDPQAPADRGALFDPAAHRAALGGVQTLTADVPAKLGRDYAVFRFGTFLPIDPMGTSLFSTGLAPTQEEFAGPGEKPEPVKAAAKK